MIDYVNIVILVAIAIFASFYKKYLDKKIISNAIDDKS